MKKWISLFTACIIGICMPQITFAEETKSKTEEERIFLEKLEELELKYKREYEEMLEKRGPDVYALLREILPKEEYGGLYKIEGIVHVIPVEGKENVVKEAIFDIRTKNRKSR